MTTPNHQSLSTSTRFPPKSKRFAAFLLIHAVVLLASLSADASTRLAIGTFGLTPEKRDGELADLIAAHLSPAPEFELVERRELNAVLKEASLGLSGIVRAKDVVRLGALLRVDQFLLGTSFSMSGTNRLIIRLVDARTGVIRAIDVFRDSGSLPNLAGEVAEYVRAQSKRPLQGHRDFVAIGVIQNLGVNNRFSEFPAQMRGSVAATLSGKVTVLERDVISFLANEVRMDIAGLTASDAKQNAQVQFGFWIVDGFYQSSEIAEPEVQLKLRVERVLGGQQSFMLQGKPDEKYFTRICDTIGQAINQPAETARVASATHKGEIEALEARAKQLLDYRQKELSYAIWLRVAKNPDKMMSALDELIRVFESILLLDPENNAARLQLASCLIYEPRELAETERAPKEKRHARACDYFREVVGSGDAKYADDARILLALTCGGFEGVTMLREFADAAMDPAQKQRFRYHRSQLLTSLEYRSPVETFMPFLRNQLLDELTDLKDSTNEPVRVSYDEVLFAFRFFPQKRETIINALLPELLEKFPHLGPQILLAAAGEQTTTDSPVTAQFLTSLRNCEQHSEAVWRASSYFTRLSSTFEDEKDVREHGGETLNQRTFDNRQYSTVVTAALARQKASEKGLAPPLTPIGKMRLAESYMALKKWKEALDLFEDLPASPQVKNECRRHLGAATQSEDLPEAAWKNHDDITKVKLAYVCIERGQYSTAVAIMDSMEHRTVRMNCGGAWGDAFTPVLPALVADEYRIKLGKPPIKDPMRFDLGDTPYVHFTRDGPRFFSFEVEGEDLWIAIYSQIKMFRGDGPFSAFKPLQLHQFKRLTQTETTSICVSSDYIWAGTFDDGLLELERKTKVCRRLTMNDGLLLNGISGLRLQGQTLWIAYHNGANGALGTLDLRTHKFSALTPNLSPEAGSNSQPFFKQALLDDVHQPPNLPVSSMTEAEPGEMWFAVEEKGLQRFRASVGDWDTMRLVSRPNTYFPAMAADVTRGILVLASLERGILHGTGGLVIYDYRQNKHSVLQLYHGLPSYDVTAVAVDGRVAWVGGRGFVAVVDIEQQKVLRVAFVSASQILRIQLGKAHAWIQISCAEPADPAYSGKAWTGVYRLNRSSIEPAVQTANRK